MTFDLVFGVIQAVVSIILAYCTKNTVVPSKWIPLQNLIVGILAGLCSYFFGIYTNLGVAIFSSLAVALAVGGVYDTVVNPIKKSTKKK